MKWVWNNTTQVCFGSNVVSEQMKEFVKPHSKVVCTFGGGSIMKNGAKADVDKALGELECEVHWFGGIPANPEYDRLVEIANEVKRIKPDLILSVGGGSVLDGTKFIALAACYEDGKDPWRILSHGEYPDHAYPVGSVMTLPATGSEWNSNFVISRRSQKQKLAGGAKMTFPLFSLLDPRYTMTLSVRQLRNGVYDSMCHCIDQFLTPQEVPLIDQYWMATMKELVEIGPQVCKDGSSYELHERLIMCATFALNLIFTLGKDTCWGIHMIGHQLTAKYGIDHGATLAICTPKFLEEQFEPRKHMLAKAAEYIFDVHEGTEEEKARAFISEMRKFIKDIGQYSHVSEVEGVKVCDGDVEEVTRMVMESVGNKPFGYHGQVTEECVRNVLKAVIV